MGRISLARVDERLVHGQVMTKWSKGMGTNAIFIVDNTTADDPFMKTIYQSTGKRGGLKVDVYKVEDVAKMWEKDQFGKYVVILLFANIDTVVQAVEAGVQIESLNIGGLVKKTPEQVQVNNAVSLSPKMIEQLDGLAAKGIDIYIQTVPDSGKTSYADARKAVVG